MAREIWVEHSYLVKATPRRGSRERWFPFKAETPVTLPEAEAFENARAATVSEDKAPYAAADRPRAWGPAKPRKSTWTKGNRSIGPSPVAGLERHSHWYAGHGGRLYRPLHPSRDRNAPLTLEELARGNADERFWDHPFVSAKSRKGFGRLAERTDADYARLRTIHVDGEEEARARVARTAGDLLLVDGALWQAASPVLVVSLGWARADCPRTASLRLSEPPFGTKESGIHFTLDRHAEALAFAESLAALPPGDGRPATRLDVDRRLVEADPRFAAVDTPFMTARALVRAVHAEAMENRHGAAAPVAEAIVEALGGERPYRGVHLAGNPFDFADRVMGWSDEALTLPTAYAGERARIADFADRLAVLAAPILHGRDRGLSAEADSAFFREDDLAGFRLYADEDPAEAEAFAP